MIPHHLPETRLVAILRGIPSAHIARVAEALIAGGIRVMEVTLDTPHALQSLATLRREFRNTATVGTGTVRTIEQANDALAAGSQFIVSPHTDLDLIRHVAATDTPIIPGALTPTEAVAATSAGADLIKLFPAGALGPPYLREIIRPLHGVRFLPTGGVTLENAELFMRSGAWGLAIGSGLIEREDVEHQHFEHIKQRAEEFVAIVQAQQVHR